MTSKNSSNQNVVNNGQASNNIITQVKAKKVVINKTISSPTNSPETAPASYDDLSKLAKVLEEKAILMEDMKEITQATIDEITYDNTEKISLKLLKCSFEDKKIRLPYLSRGVPLKLQNCN